MRNAVRAPRGRLDKVTKSAGLPSSSRTGRSGTAEVRRIHHAAAAAAAAVALTGSARTATRATPATYATPDVHAQLAAAATDYHDIKPDIDPAITGDGLVFADPTGMVASSDDYSAAAAVAAAMDAGLGPADPRQHPHAHHQQQQQQHHHLLHHHDGVDGDGDAEADADMEDDVNPTTAAPSVLQHMDLAAANMLADGGAPSNQAMVHDPTGPQQAQQQLHPQLAPLPIPMPPQPQVHSMDPRLVKTTEQFAHQSGYTELNVESALAKRLAHDEGKRHAQQRRPDQQLNLARRSNVEALFAHIAGQPAPVPCKNCHKGHGPWTSCIVVEGQMCGSCANCWFNASGARCSFHETRNPPQQHGTLVSPAASMSADPNTGFRYAAPGSGLLPSPGPAQLPGAGPASVVVPTAAGMTNTGHAMAGNHAKLQDVVSKAMGDVRAAYQDKVTRQLMLIDTTARQLQIQMLDYENLMAEINQQAGQGSGSGPGAPGQQIMGDDPSASGL